MDDERLAGSIYCWTLLSALVDAVGQTNAESSGRSMGMGLKRESPYYLYLQFWRYGTTFTFVMPGASPALSAEDIMAL